MSEKKETTSTKILWGAISTLIAGGGVVMIADGSAKAITAGVLGIVGTGFVLWRRFSK